MGHGTGRTVRFLSHDVNNLLQDMIIKHGNPTADVLTAISGYVGEGRASCAHVYEHASANWNVDWPMGTVLLYDRSTSVSDTPVPTHYGDGILVTPPMELYAKPDEQTIREALNVGYEDEAVATLAGMIDKKDGRDIATIFCEWNSLNPEWCPALGAPTTPAFGRDYHVSVCMTEDAKRACVIVYGGCYTIQEMVNKWYIRLPQSIEIRTVLRSKVLDFGRTMAATARMRIAMTVLSVLPLRKVDRLEEMVMQASDIQLCGIMEIEDHIAMYNGVAAMPQSPMPFFLGKQDGYALVQLDDCPNQDIGQCFVPWHSCMNIVNGRPTRLVQHAFIAANGCDIMAS